MYPHSCRDSHHAAWTTPAAADPTLPTARAVAPHGSTGAVSAGDPPASARAWVASWLARSQRAGRGDTAVRDTPHDRDIVEPLLAAREELTTATTTPTNYLRAPRL
jgi:hypothetical protein